VWFEVSNTSDTYYIKVVNSAGNMEGVGGDTIWLKPGELRRFRVVRDGGSYYLVPVGRVSYNLEADQRLLNSAWTVANGLPTDLVEPVSGNTERLGFKVPCTLEGADLSISWLFTGTAAADFASLATLGPSLDFKVDGSTEHAGHDAFLVNLTGAETNYHMQVGDTALTANQYITTGGTDLTDITGATVKLTGEIVLKEE
jgi:hypothetical protein